MKDRNLFHRVDTIGNIFTSGYATRENVTDGVRVINFDLSPNKKEILCLCHAFLTLSGRSFIKNPVQFFCVIPRGVPLPHSN